MSNSVRPHRRQPTRLRRPWDSPGKNTRVACHFLLQCMKVKSESEVAQSCLTLSDPMDCSLWGSSVHGIFQARILEWGAIAFSEYCARNHNDRETCIPVTVVFLLNCVWNEFGTSIFTLLDCRLSLKDFCFEIWNVWLYVTPWTTAHQAPPSTGFSRQEYWSGVPLPSPPFL